MRFDTKFKPELCQSSDQTREHLCNVHLDVEAKRMVSTDGHRMVVVPCEPEDHDATGWVTADALKAARKAAKKVKSDVAFLGANGALVTQGVSMERPKMDEHATFPPYKQVIPDYSKVPQKGMLDTRDDCGREEHGVFAIGLNAAYLREIADALGSKTGNVNLTMRGPLDPILVTAGEPDEAFAVLMPVRV